MAITKKGKRALVVGDRTFLWHVAPDSTDRYTPTLRIVERNKARALSVVVGVPSSGEPRIVIEAGRSERSRAAIISHRSRSTAR